jgi:hypothetical protein
VIRYKKLSTLVYLSLNNMIKIYLGVLYCYVIDSPTYVSEYILVIIVSCILYEICKR